MAQYQVIARKWRPQSFQDLIGQDHISTTLLNALRGDRLPQALLFTGVRGTGKTSTARILAKSLRCTNSKDYVPCGTCQDCMDITAGRAIDVIEIDGASNNGVDAIRELRDSVGYMPSSGKYKIYIIDEVHMLSTAAFNALLKTLEEPPPHVVFILATTEAQKIPNTILSRCQRFDFRRIPSRQIAEQLKRIGLAEGVTSNAVGEDTQGLEAALWAIARQADGSMRDSQSLLDQVITFSNKEITLSKVIEVLGLTDRQLVIDGVTALITRDPAMALGLVEKVNRSGVDPKIFAQDLLEEIRNALMVRLCVSDPARVVDLPDSEIQALGNLAATTTEEDLHMLFDMMLKGVNDLLRASDPRLVLEMTLLRVASSPSMMALRDLFTNGPSLAAASTTAPRAPLGTATAMAAQARANSTANETAPAPPKKLTPPSFENPNSFVSPATSRANSPADSAAISTPNPKAPSFTSAAPTTSATMNAGSSDGANGSAAGPSKYTMDSFTRPAKAGGVKTQGAAAKTVVTALPPLAPQPSNNTTAMQNDPNSTQEERDEANRPAPSRTQDPWLHFVYMVRKSNGLLGAMLENTHVVEKTETKLTIGVPKKVAFVIDKLKDPDNIRRIEQFIETVWEKHMKVEIKPAEAAAGDLTPRAKEERAKVEKTQSIEAAVEQNPLVRTAKNVFKTQVKAIRDPEGNGLSAGASAKRPK
jgi:DNA polymerase III subunit gamma/tau